RGRREPGRGPDCEPWQRAYLTVSDGAPGDGVQDPRERGWTMFTSRLLSRPGATPRGSGAAATIESTESSRRLECGGSAGRGCPAQVRGLRRPRLLTRASAIGWLMRSTFAGPIGDSPKGTKGS